MSWWPQRKPFWRKVLHTVAWTVLIIFLAMVLGSSMISVLNVLQ